jgi:hypothetical protein
MGDAAVVLAEPPQRRRQPEVALPRLSGGDGVLERGAGILPTPSRQRGRCRSERLLRGHVVAHDDRQCIP